jgi:HK97 family phage prohead protease
MKDVFQYKSIPAEIKDIDEGKGIVTGYFSAFGNVDSDGDMIMPGAFTKTIKENSKRIKHLWQHDVRYPLSKPSVLKEDTFGLYFESQISKTSYGRDVLQLYKDGVVDEHSIGFRTERKNPKEKYTELIELKLWEGSTVTFGANENTPFTGMKSATIEEVTKKISSVWKALRNGKYENDEIFEQLDIYFEQLKQTFIDLQKSTCAADEAPKPDHKGNELLESLKIYTNNLIIKAHGSGIKNGIG